ncbi:helix-turn-helix transcriptional regulator [Streptomyces catenulae]|uniref:WYL domain-containing protein n=1 Tax=Streptomyces catenulae TaxID=66875 RepID=A0ABV2YWJ8_9ACTN|nr:WYL domain-containing protein [Streptomyces catenulae]
MRAARLIKMVLLLQSRPSMTAGELARELEVSERTVGRDVLSLSEAGVPVYADRGRAGGYRLLGGYRTRLTGLGRSEAETLFLSGVPSALRELGLADAASAARLKVSAALLPELREAAAGAAQRFHLDAPAWYRSPQTPAELPSLAEAVWDDRPVRARYRRKDRDVERELEPYGLILKAGVWYVAACARREGQGATGEAEAGGGAPGPPGSRGAFGTAPGPGDAAPVPPFRIYRVDRFASVTVAEDGHFVRDPGFDLPAFWAERAAQFARSLLREEVVLRLTEPGIRRLPHVTEATAAQEAVAGARGPDPGGRWTLTLAVENAEVAYAQLLGLGPECEVLAPGPLRDRFAAAARRTAELYGG